MALLNRVAIAFTVSRRFLKRSAGDDYNMAKYYDFDSDYLIEIEPRVRHYKIHSQASLPTRSEQCSMAILKPAQKPALPKIPRS